jgi:hypothetical protein
MFAPGYVLSLERSENTSGFDRPSDDILYCGKVRASSEAYFCGASTTGKPSIYGRREDAAMMMEVGTGIEQKDYARRAVGS